MSARKVPGPSSRRPVTVRPPVWKRNQPNFAPPSSRVVSTASRPSTGRSTPSAALRCSKSPAFVYGWSGGSVPVGIGPSAASAAFGLVKSHPDAAGDALGPALADDPHAVMRQTAISRDSARITTSTTWAAPGSPLCRALVRLTHPMTSRVALALACVLVAGACAGGGTPPAVGSPSSGPVAVATTTAAPSPTAPPTPTPTPKPKIWPLTGLPAAADAALGRRPLNVRMPNDPNARPQYGLNKADIVFEMIVEGGVTRFAAIFHSQEADVVGPVRSYRWSDLHITQMLRGALVSSGSTVEERDGVTQSIKDGNMLSVDAERDGRPYYRVAFRPAPNNEFTSTPADREAGNRAGGGAPADVPALPFAAAATKDPKPRGLDP